MFPGKLILALILTLSLTLSVSAQEQFAFRISFTDKSGSPSLGNPLLLLSQRALDRRNNQGIPLDDFDRPVSPDYVDSVLTLTGGKLHLCSRWLNHCVILLSDSSGILLLQGKPFINSTRYIAYYPFGLHKNPGNENKFSTEFKNSTASKTTADPNYYGSTWNQTHLVDGECLHDQGWMGQGKMIAVLDDGYQYVNTARAFDSINAANGIIDRYNFVKADTPVYAYNSHGTLSFSTMAGNYPNIFVGAAPKAQYALYITEDQGSEQPIEMDNMLAAMERADSVGADIITSSLGYNIFFGPVFYELDYATEMDGKTTIASQGANMATKKGMLVVVSAGNEGGNTWNYILTPGDADSALTIGSVNGSGIPAGNSGFGPNSAGQVKPDVCALGNPGAAMSHDTIPFSINGTSIATPQIAGFAACLWQARPNRSAYEMRTAIQQSAHRYNNPGNQIGFGVPNFCKALWPLSVEGNPTEKTEFDNYPNPFTNEIFLSIYSSKQQDLLFTLTDINGRKVYTGHFKAENGLNRIMVSIPANLAPGVYFSKIVIGKLTEIKMLTKL